MYMNPLTVRSLYASKIVKTQIPIVYRILVIEILSYPLCNITTRSINLSAKPFGLLITNRATRERWSEGKPAGDERHCQK